MRAFAVDKDFNTEGFVAWLMGWLNEDGYEGACRNIIRSTIDYAADHVSDGEGFCCCLANCLNCDFASVTAFTSDEVLTDSCIMAKEAALKYCADVRRYVK